MLSILKKILGSSTFWVSILLPALKVLAEKLGVDVPWPVIAAGIGGYGVKEAGAHVAARQP